MTLKNSRTRMNSNPAAGQGARLFRKQVSLLNQEQADEVSASASANTMDGFMGFSIGPRTCLGHKFAKIEAVAFLTHLLREWRVEPALDDGEDVAQWKVRMFEPSFGLTLALKDVPLRFVRRRQP